MTKEATHPSMSNEEADVTVEQRLTALYRLQQIDSQIDKIRIVRGELPLEVQDMEDEVAGLQTRLEKYVAEEEEFNQLISEKKNLIEESKKLIQKYQDQEKNVRNNREYESIAKEIEFQTLEVQLAEKRIREYSVALERVQELIVSTREKLESRSEELDMKQNELAEIVKETEDTEAELQNASEENEKYIDERFLTAYRRIRTNAKNGLAVVVLDRDACGGCFNKIPYQRQMDIHIHKKIIVCEYCGRILIDQDIVAAVQEGSAKS